MPLGIWFVWTVSVKEVKFDKNDVQGGNWKHRPVIANSGLFPNNTTVLSLSKTCLIGNSLLLEWIMHILIVKVLFGKIRWHTLSAHEKCNHLHLITLPTCSKCRESWWNSQSRSIASSAKAFPLSPVNTNPQKAGSIGGIKQPQGYYSCVWIA